MRAGSRPQYRRLRRIVEMLKARARSGRLPTMADFQRELEASRRTIARDLDFLRVEENAPIAFDPKGRGYRTRRCAATRAARWRAASACL
ncbi:MAG TPA: hypothetical protein PLU30_25180 [Verrucomicrobiae bacterium]|nr:hypothetical protein [Verrucomicrobiae bacterium]